MKTSIENELKKQTTKTKGKEFSLHYKVKLLKEKPKRVQFSKMMKMNCIKNLEEFNDLSKNVETYRIKLSYYNFTKTSKSSITDGYKNLLVGQYIKIILYIIVMLISLIGNLLIIFVIIFNKFMRKSTNFFILNLAICDLAILFSCMWVQIIFSVSKYWLWGELFCKINSFLQMVSIIASVLTLSLISCDRYIGILHPLKSKIITKKSYYFLIASIWIVSIIISIPTYVYRTYTERKWSDFVERHCDDLGWPVSLVTDENGCVLKTVRPLKRIYYTTVILFLFFLPLLIMSITYSIIIRKLWNDDIIGESYSFNNETLIKKRKRV